MQAKLKKLHELLLQSKSKKTTYDKWEFTEYIKNYLKNDEYLATPFELSWQITSNCNLKCDYCYANASNGALKNDLSLYDCHKIIEKIHKSKIYDVSLEGGEPFFRKDILDIIKHLKEKNIFLDILTNGYLINEEICNRLENYLDKRVDNIQISIDSIANKGIPIKLQRIIKMLSDYNFNLRFNVVLNMENTNDLKLLYEQLKNLNVNGSFTVAPIIPIGRGKNIVKPSQNKLIDSFIELKQIEHDEININGIEPIIKTFQIYNKLASQLNLNEIIKRRNCSGGRVKVNISSNGNVYPCVFLQDDKFLLGNIINEDFVDIWNNKKANVVRKTLDIKKCTKCNNYQCAGGCLGIIYSINDTFDAVDPRCVYK